MHALNVSGHEGVNVSGLTVMKCDDEVSPVSPQFVMELTFSEAAKGVNKELSVNIDDTCPRCDGHGSEPGTRVSHCHYCNGTGMVSFTLTRARAISVMPCKRALTQEVISS